MFGKNKILKAENHSGENLDVVEIFPTLQGEGPYAGHPAVFVRLGGCNLACDFCDTEFENYQNFSLENILLEVEKLAKNSAGEIVRKLVVITGGEPLRQPIGRFCEELIARNFLVQIETNGTLFRELPKEVKIICSPKISNGKYHAIRPDLLSRVNAFKFIVRSPAPESASEGLGKDGLLSREILRCAWNDSLLEYCDIAEVGQKKFDIPVYVQPMDEYDEAKNRGNLQHAQKLCDENGYFLSLQIHKILRIR